MTLTAERAREVLNYDPETGEFRWKVTRSRATAGDVAGHVQKFQRGFFYRVIRVDSKLYLAHRLSWLMMTGSFPTSIIDHKDGNTLNNAFGNLREATFSQNIQNTKRRSDNTSLLKGVSWDKINQKWVARIRVPKGRYKNLGRFLSCYDAHSAYAKAAEALYGEFSRLE